LNEVKPKPSAALKQLGEKEVSLYIASTFYTFSGTWQWDGYSNTVFCSDVLFTPRQTFTGTRGIFHPDDLPKIRSTVAHAGSDEFDLQFRIITSYGELKTISGKNIRLAASASDHNFFDATVQQEINRVELERRLDEFGLKSNIADYAERIVDSGIWFFNKQTLQTWYSDNVYRIYGVAPQSINAHLNSFLAFIHPQEKDIVTDAIEKSIKEQVPVHLDFHIITADKKERWIRYVTHWVCNTVGDDVLSGLIIDNTEQKNAERKMESLKADALFQNRLLYLDERAAIIGHWEVNLLTRKVHFTEMYWRIFGQKGKGEAAGFEYFINLIHADDREAVSAAYRKIHTQKEFPEITFRIIRPDGKTRHLRQYGSLITKGGEEMVAGYLQDVTVAVQSEKKIHELKQAFALHQFTNNQAEHIAQFGSWLWDLQTSAVNYSNGFKQLFNLKTSPEEPTQKTILKLIHADDRKLFADSLVTMLTKAEESEIEFRMIRQGLELYIRAAFKCATFANKNFFVATFQDVSAEVNLRRQLHERIQLSELISENILDRAIVTDVNNTIVLWNRQCEELYKIRKDAAIGKNIFDVFPQWKNERHLGLFQRVLEGEPVMLAYEKATVRDEYHNLHMLPLKNEQGEVFGIIHLLHDVTKEVLLERHLKDRIQFIENLLDATVDRIVVLDRNMNYSYWNKRAEQYYGLGKEEVIGKNILELFPSLINDPSYESFRKVLKGETVHIQAQQNLLDKKAYFETYLIPLLTDQKEVSGILWIVHDLSAEWQLQQEGEISTQKLKEQAHYLQRITETTPDMISIMELETRKFTFLNSETFKANGFDTDKMKRELEIGNSSWVHVEDKEVLSDYFRRLKTASDKDTVTAEYRAKTDEGVWNWFSVRGKIFQRDNKENVTHVLNVIENITSRKRVEEKLRQTEHWLQQTAQAAPDAITVYDLKEKLPVYLNHRLAEWVGYSSDELIEMGIKGRLELIHPDDRLKLLHFNEKVRAAADDTILTIEYRIRTKDGDELWLRNRSKVFLRNEKEQATHSISFLQHVTKELGLREQLKDRSRFVENILDSSIDRIMVLDKDLTIVGWNTRCEEHFGTRKEDAIGKNFLNRFPLLKQDEQMLEAITIALKGTLTHIPERRSIYGNGYTEMFLIPLKNAKEEIDSVLLLSHDITKRILAEEELKELNKTLEQKNKELENKNEEIASFAFVASHDLKEPLRKIHTFSDWLVQREADNLSDTGKRYTERILIASKRLETLIEDVLVLTKIHSDKQRQCDVDLNVVLEKAKEELATEIEESEAIIVADELPVIKGNNNQLLHLFNNLLSNAIKFQKPGNKPLISITAELVTENIPPTGANAGTEYIKVCFTDNGFGFDQKYAKKIFQVFQRLHGKHEYTGTGMGLAICKKIMDNHEGFITVSAEEDKGASFSCYFPL
jgi:PAS domain S-box-containing protein